jgi:hypothetical protein
MSRADEEIVSDIPLVYNATKYLTFNIVILLFDINESTCMLLEGLIESN